VIEAFAPAGVRMASWNAVRSSSSKTCSNTLVVGAVEAGATRGALVLRPTAAARPRSSVAAAVSAARQPGRRRQRGQLDPARGSAVGTSRSARLGQSVKRASRPARTVEGSAGQASLVSAARRAPWQGRPWSCDRLEPVAAVSGNTVVAALAAGAARPAPRARGSRRTLQRDLSEPPVQPFPWRGCQGRRGSKVRGRRALPARPAEDGTARFARRGAARGRGWRGRPSSDPSGDPVRSGRPARYGSARPARHAAEVHVVGLVSAGARQR